MRLLIKFKNKEKFLYQQNQLVGLVYSLIKETSFFCLHNLPQNQPRFFNFSQMFIADDNHLSFIISSPVGILIKELSAVVNKKKYLKLGQNLLEIDNSNVLSLKINHSLITIKTETPIVIRIPKERYQEYMIKHLKFLENYPYFYWRPKEGVPFEPFVRQLEARVFKEYKLFAGKKEIKETPIFYKFKYIKTVDLPYFKNGQKNSRIGTLWEFETNPKIELDLIKFILDTGLGELNSQGYGFLKLLT